MSVEAIGRAEVPIDLADLARSDSGIDFFETYPLPRETVLIERQPVTVEIRHVRYRIRQGRGQAHRDMFGTFVRGQSGALQRLSHLTGASSLRHVLLTNANELLDFTFEQETLEALEGQYAGNWTGSFITAVPGAQHETRVLYPTAAPGIRLDDSVEIVAFGRRMGWVSDDQAAAILDKIHDTARTGLGRLHQAGRSHGHPNSRNFIVSLMAVARVVDFSFSDTVNSTTAASDRASFETQWKAAVNEHGLGELSTSYRPNITDPAEKERAEATAGAQFEMLVTGYTLYDIGVNVTDLAKATQALRQAEERALGRMRVVTYPKRPDYQTPAEDPAVTALAREIRQRAASILAQAELGSGQ